MIPKLPVANNSAFRCTASVCSPKRQDSEVLVEDRRGLCFHRSFNASVVLCKHDLQSSPSKSSVCSGANVQFTRIILRAYNEAARKSVIIFSQLIALSVRRVGGVLVIWAAWEGDA